MEKLIEKHFTDYELRAISKAMIDFLENDTVIVDKETGIPIDSSMIDKKPNSLSITYRLENALKFYK